MTRRFFQWRAPTDADERLIRDWGRTVWERIRPEVRQRLIDLAVNPPCIGPIGPMPTKAYRRPGDLCYLPTFGFRKWSQAADRAKAGQP